MKEIDRTIEELELLIGLEYANAEMHHKKTDRFFPALVNAVALLKTQQGKTPNTKYDLNKFSEVLKDTLSKVSEVIELVKTAQTIEKTPCDNRTYNASEVSTGVAECAISKTEQLITNLIGGITRVKAGK